jgi:hypothetical protein
LPLSIASSSDGVVGTPLAMPRPADTSFRPDKDQLTNLDRTSWTNKLQASQAHIPDKKLFRCRSGSITEAWKGAVALLHERS